MPLFTRRDRSAAPRRTQPRTRRALSVLSVGCALATLTACSPTQMRSFITKTFNTTTVTVAAKAGADDGGGSHFRAKVICDGESFWRTGREVDVNAGPTVGDEYHSRVQCFDNRRPVAISWERW